MREVASSYEIRSGIWAQYWPGVDSNEKVTAGHGIEEWWSVKNVVKSKQTKKNYFRTQCFSHKPLLRKVSSCTLQYQLHKIPDNADTDAMVNCGIAIYYT